MRCPACATENPADHHFCDTCGEPLESHCAQCSAVGRPGARFCGQCGAPIEATTRVAEPPTAEPRAATAPRGLEEVGRNGRSAIDGERRRVTVLFADMADAGFADQCAPEEVHQIMNHCFACITDAVQGLDGTINQYTGEGVMALFGAPIALEDGPRRAVQSALDIQRALREYGRALEAERGLRVQMRIG